MNTDPLLDIIGLKTYFFTRKEVVRVLDGLSFRVQRNEILGVVGESGSGKSVTGYSIVRLLKKPGRIVGGRILLDDTDLVNLTESEMQEVRGRQISMIFQNARTCLNPVVSVGRQLMDVARARRGLAGGAARSSVHKLFESVGLLDVERLMTSYPHELSGGMCQRVMIALALACSPRLLIADEPTTGLDVSTQHGILHLLRQLAETTGMSQIVISHDLGVVAEICDTVAVMYAGCVVEYAPVMELFDNPQHPYTLGLLASRPKLGASGILRAIPGRIPSPLARPLGCPFHPRCARAQDICRKEMPPAIQVGGSHTVACYFPGPTDG